MKIRYNNGQVLEAVLLSRTEDSMRVAIEGADDIRHLTQIRGNWVSDECEPVQVEFAWSRHGAVEDVKEEDCVCSHELAARLIRMLVSGENEPKKPSVPVEPPALSIFRQVI